MNLKNGNTIIEFAFIFKTNLTFCYDTLLFVNIIREKIINYCNLLQSTINVDNNIYLHNS